MFLLECFQTNLSVTLMTYVLRLDTSPRINDSISRKLANQVVDHSLNLNPSLNIKVRDLSTENLPHISEQTITGFYTSANEMSQELKSATALSDQLIDELLFANTLLISAPMYNFGIPSSLKAWVDQIVRINKTFSFEDGALKGLVPIRRAILVLSYGATGYSSDGNLKEMNFLQPYLTSLMAFLGITDTRVVSVEGTNGDAKTLEAQISSASTQISQLFIEEA